MSTPRTRTDINKRRIDSPTTDRPEEKRKKTTNESQAGKSSQKQVSETSSATSVTHPYQRLIKALKEERTADALEIYQDNYDLMAEYINWNNPNLGKPGHITKKHLYQLALGLTRDMRRNHFKSYAHLFDVKGLLEVAKEIAKDPKSSAAVLGTNEEMDVINKLLSFQKSDITNAIYKEDIPQSNPRETYFQRYMRLVLHKSYKGLTVVEFFNKITNSAVSDAYNSIFDPMPKRNPRDVSQTYIEYAIEQYTQRDNGIASPSTGHKEKANERAMAMIVERLLNGPFRVDNKVAAFKKLFENYSVVRKIFEAIPSKEIPVIHSSAVYNEILEALATIESQEENEEVLIFTPSVRVGFNQTSRTPSPAPDSETEQREEPRSPKGKERADSESDDETEDEVITVGEIASSSQTSTTSSNMPINRRELSVAETGDTTSQLIIESFNSRKKNKFLELCKTEDSKGVQAVIDQSQPKKPFFDSVLFKFLNEYLGKSRHECEFLFNLKLNIAGKAETTLLDFYLDSFDSDSKRFERLIDFPNILCLDYLLEHPTHSKAFADHFHKLEADKKIDFFLAILNYPRLQDEKSDLMFKLLIDKDVILELLKKFKEIGQKRKPAALKILSNAIINLEGLRVDDRLKLLNKMKNKIDKYASAKVKAGMPNLDGLITRYEEQINQQNPSSSSCSRSTASQKMPAVDEVVIGVPIFIDNEDKQEEEILAPSQPPSMSSSHGEKERESEEDETVFGVPLEMSVPPTRSPEPAQRTGFHTSQGRSQNSNNVLLTSAEQGSFAFVPQPGNIYPYGMEMQGMGHFPQTHSHFYPWPGAYPQPVWSGAYSQPAWSGVYSQPAYPPLAANPNPQVQEGKVLIGKEELEKLNNVAKAFAEVQKKAEESKKKADEVDGERERLAKENAKLKRVAKEKEELDRLRKENEDLKRTMAAQQHPVHYHPPRVNPSYAVPPQHASSQSGTHHRDNLHIAPENLPFTYYPAYPAHSQSVPLHTRGFMSQNLHRSSSGSVPAQNHVHTHFPSAERMPTVQGTAVAEERSPRRVEHLVGTEQHPNLRDSSSNPNQGKRS